MISTTSMEPNKTSPDSGWLREVLEEVGLQQFEQKLTNELQLTKLSHFDFVSENDLLQLGLSRPAAKRLLAAIKKRKSFVTALKNKIVNKLIPTSIGTSSSTTSSPSQAGSSSQHHHSSSNHDSFSSKPNKHSSETFFGSSSSSSNNYNKNNDDFGRLTCLINSQDVQIKEEIGHGVHGFVKKGEWTTPTGRVVEVAVKILKKDVMAEPGASFNDFVKEISVMHQLNHPNIIKLYGVVLSSPMMMVTELAPFGNLRDRLRKESGSTPISQLINFGVQITSGMEYLEAKRFIHRDLAARNIFISHGRKILIGDLGLMRVIPNQEDHYVMSERTKIPYPWCAPESLRYKQFSSASDVYMFGVTLWEMFSFGKEPWTGLNLTEILENISTQHKRLPCPKACPTMVYQTLLQCWNTDPSCRPNFSTLYQYLSTSYPLEVRATQQISELSQKRVNGNLLPNDLSVDSDAMLNSDIVCEQLVDDNSYRSILECSVDDRILVIDGQPEKYWWKGQNQRTFGIGWFPLSSTRWMAPKKGTNYISRPLKNSFIHAGHCGKDGMWGSPKFIDYMNLKNGNQVKTNNHDNQAITLGNLTKAKSTKSRLSKLFGINDAQSTSNNNQGSIASSSSSSSKNHLLPHSYQKFCNQAYQSTINRSNSINKRNSSDFIRSYPPFTQMGVTKAQSDEKIANDDEPPLIDLSEEIANLPSSMSLLNTASPTILDTAIPPFQNSNALNNNSLIDVDHMMSTTFRPIVDIEAPRMQRHSSDTNLNAIAEAFNGVVEGGGPGGLSSSGVENYKLSWAGSWNTGTFDNSSNGNIYSNYYCPQDGATTNIEPNCQQQKTQLDIANIAAGEDSNISRYYSAVTHENN